MKYRLLFIVGFLLYPMISWTFIECYPSFETDSFLLKIYTLLTGFSIFFSVSEAIGIFHFAMFFSPFYSVLFFF